MKAPRHEPPDIETARLVDQRVEMIRPLLAGLPGTVQGAILADLLAMWIAGHVAGNDTELVRRSILRLFLRTVRRLVPVNEQMIRERIRDQGSA